MFLIGRGWFLVGYFSFFGPGLIRLWALGLFFPGIGLLNGQIQIEFIRSEFSLHAKQNMQAGHGAQHSYT